MSSWKYVLRGWYASNLIIWVLVWLELHPWEWCSPHWVGHATCNHNIYISPLPLTECFSNVSSCASTSTWSIIMAFHFERDKILRKNSEVTLRSGCALASLTRREKWKTGRRLSLELGRVENTTSETLCNGSASGNQMEEIEWGPTIFFKVIKCWTGLPAWTLTVTQTSWERWWTLYRRCRFYIRRGEVRRGRKAEWTRGKAQTNASNWHCVVDLNWNTSWYRKSLTGTRRIQQSSSAPLLQSAILQNICDNPKLN